jgi:hypothetical protein
MRIRQQMFAERFVRRFKLRAPQRLRYDGECIPHCRCVAFCAFRDVVAMRPMNFDACPTSFSSLFIRNL